MPRTTDGVLETDSSSADFPYGGQSLEGVGPPFFPPPSAIWESKTYPSGFQTTNQNSIRMRHGHAPVKPAPIIDRPRIISNQRDFLDNHLRKEINNDMYPLLVNTMGAIVAVRSVQTSDAWAKICRR